MIGRAAPPDAGGASLLATLRVGAFRRLWLSSVSLGFGQQMEILILGWWILEVTDNPLLVGVIGGFRWWPSLLGPFGGVLIDRFDRRRVLLLVLGIVTGGAGFLLALSALGRLEVWHTFAVALIAGTARTVDAATRQAVIGDVLPRGRIISGIALNQAALNGTAILAPPIGGLLYKYVGFASGFAAITGLYALSLVLAHGLPALPVGAAKAGESAWRKLIEGLDFVRRDEIISALLWIAAIANLCGFPLVYVMLPVFARDILGTDSAGLGVLTGAIGAGALLGNLTLGSIRGVGHRGRFVLGTMGLWMALLAAFALSRSFALSLVLLCLIGAASSTSMATLAARLMTGSPIDVRGRVMGVRMFAIATLPVATTAMGGAMELIGRPAGPPLTLILTAGLGAALTGLVAVRLPGIWRREG
ncbi:MAG TPA: MFS transporter [Dehalococcoidia bacterium]|nr:MFS transporter [Dehalococcoidia bacterium]